MTAHSVPIVILGILIAVSGGIFVWAFARHYRPEL